jgi:ectoine hydroxylase-related dioxygenase (phytanoyl-CoA dioxygenase family)
MQIDRMSFNPPVRPGMVNPGLGHRLHWDVSLAPPVPLAIQGIMYLTDTSPDQGALELVPGFHRIIDEWVAGQTDPRAVDLSGRAITVGGKAGDLVLWHQALPHGASPNRAVLPRLAHYMTMYRPDMTVAEEWR